MSEGPGVRPEPDVYSVLLILATAMALGATVFLAIKSQQWFDSWIPF